MSFNPRSPNYNIIFFHMRRKDDDISSHTLTNETLNVSQNTSESKDYKTASSIDVISETTSPISSAYSPPRTNSVSLPHTPALSRTCSWNKELPIKVDKERSDTKSINGKARHVFKLNEVDTVCEDGYSDCEDDFPTKRIKRMKKLNVRSNPT